jgi:hypothetical protein
MDGWMIRVLGGLVVLGIAIGFKFMNKGDDGKEIRADAHKLVAQLPSYKENRQYYDWLCDVSHDEAFDKAYTVTYGRRSRNEFDEEVYIEHLFEGMAAKARQDKSDHIAEECESALREMRGEPIPTPKDKKKDAKSGPK